MDSNHFQVNSYKSQQDNSKQNTQSAYEYTLIKSKSMAKKKISVYLNQERTQRYRSIKETVKDTPPLDTNYRENIQIHNNILMNKTYNTQTHKNYVQNLKLNYQNQQKRQDQFYQSQLRNYAETHMRTKKTEDNHE